MAQGEAPDVGLVDDRPVVRGARRPVVAPVEERVDHYVGGHVRGAVGGVDPREIAEPVPEQRLMPADLAIHRLPVRVEQQLRRVTPVAPGGFVRAVHAVAVPLAGPDVGQVPVPHEPVHLGQLDPVLGPGPGAVTVEQA